MTLWGGRFEGGAGAPDELFRRLNDSLPIDQRLAGEDIEGSIAWAAALQDAGVVTADEGKSLRVALEEIATAAAAPGAFDDADDEDIHTWVESRLIERVGDLGKKLHTGRSRNDQVATDLRLWTRRAIAARRSEIRAAQAALVRLADRERETVIPGYTHLQRAQPVLFAHWCLAYVEMLGRDDDRLTGAARRASECPLGAAALAGTTYPIDRNLVASALGFDAPTANSLDAVSDRDFVFETLSALALCGLHLSRLAEDLIFYASGEAGFVELDDATSTGSSLMPQKKNPDGLELLRGKAASMLGSLMAMGATLKGLPLAYNKDLQDDKTHLFAAMDTLELCLGVLPIVLDGIALDAGRTQAAAAAGHANATELADYLVGRGIPFREAHAITGRIVRHAIERGVALEMLAIDEMKAFAPQIDEDVRGHLALEAVLAKRDVYGGTAPTRVHAALEKAKERYATVQPA